MSTFEDTSTIAITSTNVNSSTNIQEGTTLVMETATFANTTAATTNGISRTVETASVSTSSSRDNSTITEPNDTTFEGSGISQTDTSIGNVSSTPYLNDESSTTETNYSRITQSDATSVESLVSTISSNEESTTAEPNDTTLEEGSGITQSDATPADTTSINQTSRITVTSTAILATNVSTNLSSSSPLVTNANPTPNNLLFGIFEIYQFALIFVGIAVLLILAVAVCWWCRKQKKTKNGKLTRMETMWDTGKRNDIIMVNITPTTNLWNSTESLAKTTDVEEPKVVNVFENQFDDNESVLTGTLKRRQNSSVSNSTSNTNPSTASPQSRSLMKKKTLTKVEMPTLDTSKASELQKTTASEKALDDISETGSVFDDTNITSPVETKKMETFSVSNETPTHSNNKDDPPASNIPTFPPPPPPTKISNEEVDATGTPTLPVDEKKVNSFLYSENKIPAPPPPPPI